MSTSRRGRTGMGGSMPQRFGSSRSVLSNLLTLLGSATAILCLDACAGDVLWNQQVTADIGHRSDLTECAPAALEGVPGMYVDRKKIIYQYKIVPIELTLSGKVTIQGDARRTGPTAATIAGYGRQAEEPVAFKDEIAAKLQDLRKAVQSPERRS